MLPGRRDGEGRAYVVAGPVAATDTFQGGIAISALGQVRYIAGVPTKFPNGLGVNDANLLTVGAGPIVNYLEGIPRNSVGAIVAQLDVAPAATDPFLGGLRIGPTGGVYLSSAVPPASSYSPIQSGGVLWTLNGAATVVDGAVVLNGSAGTSISTPHNAAYVPTDRFSFAITANLADWSPATPQFLVGQYSGGAPTTDGPSLQLNTGKLFLSWSDGAGGVHTAASTVEVPASLNGKTISVLGDYNATQGIARFWYSLDRGQTKVKLGADVLVANVGFNSAITQPVTIGAFANIGFLLTGNVYSSAYWVDDVLVLSFNAADAKFRP